MPTAVVAAAAVAGEPLEALAERLDATLRTDWLVPLSRLQQAPPPLRTAVLGKNAGAVNVAAAGGAYTLVLVVAHELAGQRDLSTPGMKERITETLRGRKEQMLRLAYLTAARADAKVENYLAKRLVEANGAVPSLLPGPGSK